MPVPNPFRVALVSDTHNLVRPELLRFLAGCDAIVHAGDICDSSVLAALAVIAPLTAVRGNNDRGAWAEALPVQTVLEIGGVKIAVVHELPDLRDDPASRGIAVVVSGHSHKPSLEARDGVLYVNPGSAGPRRFRLPVTAAMLTIGKSGELSVEHAQLVA
ncbi:MAG: metallophosphoesterase [Paraburkholderia sp.]|uniref:metallophosphoesterase family protein n=1 Tax=Paraburkholderia sp. TaxID=1926495 RepID=UPI001214AEFC|nr:metallophosphoesterase family protein [Paraburkholderia sp.]TAM06686.1 MAG: metallophosphoesterase [Paraburkholderia sp.]TAM32661.1 MAG: metallophosphoesterase [Paraburkholderia sp.]